MAELQVAGGVEAWRPHRDLAQIKSDLAWRRLLDALAQKYSPNQPRVPAGSTGGGRPRVIIDTTDLEDEAGGEDFGAFGEEDFFADGVDGDSGLDDLDDDFSRNETDGRFDESDSRPSNSDRGNERDRPDEQPRRINDTRIVSDADPEPIRPGQRYAQLDKIADGAGKPYYEPGGHH